MWVKPEKGDIDVYPTRCILAHVVWALELAVHHENYSSLSSHDDTYDWGRVHSGAPKTSCFRYQVHSFDLGKTSSFGYQRYSFDGKTLSFTYRNAFFCPFQWENRKFHLPECILLTAMRVHHHSSTMSYIVLWQYYVRTALCYLVLLLHVSTYLSTWKLATSLSHDCTCVLWTCQYYAHSTMTMLLVAVVVHSTTTVLHCCL